MLASGVALTGWSPRLGKRLSGVALHRFISCYSAGSAWRRRGSRVAWRRRKPRVAWAQAPAWRGGSRVAGEQAPRGGGEGAGPAWRGGGAGSAWRRSRSRVAEAPAPRGGGPAWRGRKPRMVEARRVPRGVDAGPAWRGGGAGPAWRRSRVAGRRPRGAPGRLPLHSRRGRARAHPRRRGSPLRVAGPCGPDSRCEPLFGRRDGCCRLSAVRARLPETPARPPRPRHGASRPCSSRGDAPGPQSAP